MTVQPRNWPNVGQIVPMPSPTDTTSADGYDAFNKSVTAANANIDRMKTWANSNANTTELWGREYGIADIVMQPDFTCQSFFAVKVSHFIVLEAVFTYNGATLSAGTNCILTVKPNICVLPSALWTQKVYGMTVNARIVNTAAMVTMGWPSTEMMALHSVANPSRTFAAGSQLLVHANYMDQGSEGLPA